MDSNLKVGSVATKGLYVGSTEIMGGGWDGILSSLVSIASDYEHFFNTDGTFIIIVVNFTDLEFVIVRDGVETNIPPYHVEWYSINKGSTVSVRNRAGKIITFLKHIINNEYIDIAPSKSNGFTTKNFGGDNTYEIITYIAMK